MRVMLLSHFFPPEVHGGTQSYLEALALELASRGHEVLVLTGSARFTSGGSISRENRGGFELVRLHRDQATEFFSGDLGCPRLLEACLAETRSFAPDLVHLHHWHGLARGLAAALTEAGIPTLVTLHDLFVSCPRHFRMPDARSFCTPEVTFADCARCVAADLPQLPVEALEFGLGQRHEAFRRDLAAAAAVLTVSRAQRDFIAGLPGFGDQAMSVLPIGTPAMPAVVGPEPLPGELRIVNWAGLDPRKGSHVLLQAIARTESPESFHLSLYGRPAHDDYMSELHQLALGLDVRFLGGFEDEERAGFATTHDLAVMPYLAFETYALVVDEAMHLGLPVIVSDRGAPKERVGARGLVVPADDPRALARELDRLRLEPERLSAMRQASGGPRLLDQHFAELLELYREIATRKPG